MSMISGSAVDLLQSYHGLGKPIQCHHPLVIGGPQTPKKVRTNGKEGDMLNVGIVFGMISNDFR
jgi:hypothetical protein